MVQIERNRLLTRRIVKLMGNSFEFTVTGKDAAESEICIDKAVEEVKRIERLLTTFSETSQTAIINRNAGICAVKVDKEIYDLVERSLKISEITQGAFDLSYGSADKRLWNFDTAMKQLPDRKLCREMVRLINYKNIHLDKKNGTVLLKEKGMRIGFGGIGKGYAADRAKKILLDNGVTNGVVNAAGDLVTWGVQPNGKPWVVGIADPARKNSAFSSLEISNQAIATSGNYEKFVMIGGKKYSHTIDPKTGYPISGIKSVTVISPIAELSDAMATPVMVMGIRAGMDMVNQVKGMACIVIDDNDRLFTSANIQLN